MIGLVASKSSSIFCRKERYFDIFMVKIKKSFLGFFLNYNCSYILKNILGAIMQLPESINIHITNVCNYQCKFCYYRKFDKKKWIETHDFINILKQLKNSPVKKINLAGGEPLLHPNIKNLLQIMRDMGFISSIITNGSKLNTQWLDCHGNNIDLIGISCDSALESIEKGVGRGNGKHVASVISV